MSLRKKYVNSSLENKECGKCKKTFPRNEDYFYGTKHRTKANTMQYDSYCITCRNEHTKKRRRKDGGKKKRKSDLKYRQTERGYLIEKWNSIKNSNKKCMIKSFEEFFECWQKQKEEYGEQCPYYPHIKLTRILGKGNKHKIDSNLSVDRLANCLPYSKDNIMFVSWKANNEKGNVSYYLARRIIDFVHEREKLRMYVEIDTHERNGQKFSFEKYHQRLAEEKLAEEKEEELSKKVEKTIAYSEKMIEKGNLILEKSREQTKRIKEELKSYEME